ncbi:hypothetical protein EJ05DRAFT_498190 [Pseudovirgaria hyperparasitica]|uniref:VHS domain-containing protein n=1 Tax=Pseudovirgaria hyperparasitica TaxID=470096 RepID=A0A6A6WDU1_9PEZI|nr:uncharacterized protein EJ05DRAFT_498190 [Pseudovirgaria hyperparasitica]KAF2760224.1 hypothetical protein EJ05DRAFT_498190 [Pseudovirgaria hyperparasitica]
MFSTQHPYSAVTVQIDRLTSEQYEEDDISGIVDLIEVIRIQASGPTEAARAIRKKLHISKYGDVHRQLRALTILDGLIQNAGSRFQRTFADEPLLERLRVMARDDMIDKAVKDKCNLLFRQWAVAYKGTQGLSGIATVYKQLPQKKRPTVDSSRVIRENNREAEREEEPEQVTQHRRNTSSKSNPATSQGSGSRPNAATLGPSTPASSSIFKRDKKSKGKPFNLEREKPQLLETIASASVASTNLLNGLQLVNREQSRVSENAECVKRFELCKRIRRQVLRYIQLIETNEQWLGGLLNANDELVKALMAFEIMDKSIDDDSDSDTEAAITQSNMVSSSPKTPHEAMAGLNIRDEDAPPKPPRPTHLGMPPVPQFAGAGKQRLEDSEPEDDDEDPFGDQNAVKTPYIENDQMTW